MTVRSRSYIRGCGAGGLPAREIGGRELTAGAAMSSAIPYMLVGQRRQAGWLRSKVPTRASCPPGSDGGLAEPELRGVRPVTAPATAPMPGLYSSLACPGWTAAMNRNSMIATMPLAMATGSGSGRTVPLSWSVGNPWTQDYPAR